MAEPTTPLPAKPDLRVQLAWRLWGAAIGLVAIQHLRNYPVEFFFTERPLVFHAFWICALATLVLGPRLVVLGAAALSGLAFLVHAALDPVGLDVFYGDEYAVQVLVPVAGFALAVWGRVRKLGAAQWNHEQLHMMRSVLLVTLAAAAFHKINADFLDPATSCAGLSKRHHDWWGLPNIITPPWLVIAGEAFAVLMLRLRPRTGIFIVLGLTAGLAAIGPAGFNMTIVALCVAFFPEGDVPTLRRTLRRPLVPLVLGLVTCSLAFALWQGPMRFLRYGYFALGWSVVAGCWLAIAWRRGRPLALLSRRIARTFGAWRPSPRRWRTPAWSSTFVLLLVVNAATPYLGVKHRYAAAMLSNLRADGSRFNHLVVPRALMLRDDYVHVLEVWAPGKTRSKHFKRGVFAPEVFAAQMEAASAAGERVGIRVRFRDETKTFARVGADLSAPTWAKTLPRRPLLARKLAAGRQACVH